MYICICIYVSVLCIMGQEKLVFADSFYRRMDSTPNLFRVTNLCKLPAKILFICYPIKLFEKQDHLYIMY